MAKRIIIVDPFKIKKKNTPDFKFLKKPEKEEDFIQPKLFLEKILSGEVDGNIVTLIQRRDSKNYIHLTGRIVDQDESFVYLLDPKINLFSEGDTDCRKIELGYLKTTCLMQRVEKKYICS